MSAGGSPWRAKSVMTTADALDRGREAFGRWAWADAFEELSPADQEAPLAPEDLERLAAAAYLVGRDADRDAVLARAHQQWLRLVAWTAPPGAGSGWPSAC
jgi:hypothetical protein